MQRATVRVAGVVQSVGFRPFVYRRAVEHGLDGRVRNLGDAGVEILVEGEAAAIDALLEDVRTGPSLARVEDVTIDREGIAESNYESFEIAPSSRGSGEGGTIPPDTAICEACLSDMRDPESRYHRYWATSCVDCGPRFTVIEGLPYDRPATAMAAFPMCGDCQDAYEAPADRRYHAQTIACGQCGPTLRYGSIAPSESNDPHDPAGGRDPFPDQLEETVDGAAAVEQAGETLAAGGAVVIKGIGGAHLACDARNRGAVAALRQRTGRPEKPFAVMVPDDDAAEDVAILSGGKRASLESMRRPILLLPAIENELAAGIAPDLHTLGVLLPYAGVHHLLFEQVDSPLVMTSANLPGRPMRRSNAQLVAELGDVADGALLHDRRIVARCDDSVARFADGDRRLIRRSRGFAPTPVPVPGAGDAAVLGVGPELDATAALLQRGDCFLTQYIGDVDDVETVEYHESAIEHLLDVTGADWPATVAHDAHPSFNTTALAEALIDRGDADRAVAVQHHHAHAASVLAEHDVDRAVALTLDGVGYGPDGTVWGGEILDASRAAYDRVGGLAPVPMPGGDRATRYPGRLVAGLVHATDPDRVEPVLARHDVALPGEDEELDIVRQQLGAGVNTPSTSSAGRFLDAVSALLGVCTERTYEGEPAMKLEGIAAPAEPVPLEIPRTPVDGRTVVATPELFADLVELLEAGVARSTVAATAQEALARGLADLAVEVAAHRGRAHVALSGGVAYNDHIARRIRETVTAAGLEFLGNERVPPGDGGIAYGQIAVVAARQGAGGST